TKPWGEGELISSVRQSLELFNLREEKQRLVKELEKYNISLEKRVEERTNQLLAINSEAEIGKHTSQIVHNLNNFLNNIQGALGLLGAAISGKNPDINKAREYYNFTVSNVDSLSKIIAEILIRSGNKDKRKDEDIDINQLIEKEMLFWEMNPVYKYKIKKEVLFDKNLPRFRGSQIQVKQILDNLIKNSIDAMEDSDTRQLSIQTKGIDNNILIEISDTGEGIAEENLSRVFSPGYTSKPVGKGTGLGLASVKTMVEAYSGSIDIKSKPGEGTTVSIQIPVQ
ncbi:MAG: HAMP domain-containing histidine kinase, partial [Deltaproteobacteria bacterium]|nr:HAMP domain-containing histidine kinase [Deltaproteobacteria bacterium]